MNSTASKSDYRALQGLMTQRLVALGRSLTPAQWVAPSLCEGWRACDVGHQSRPVATKCRSHGPAGGPAVEGPAEDLLLAMCGRPAGLAGLQGDGVAELTARISR